MYQHAKENPWKSLPATIVGLLLVIGLFFIMPFANHVSYTRLKSSGGLSPVPTSPTPALEVAEIDDSRAVAEVITDFELPDDSATGAKSTIVALEPVATPVLDPYVRSERKQLAFVFDVSDLDLPPVPIHRVSPRYPQELYDSDTEGQVFVEFKVDKTGRVLGVKILEETHELFGKAVVEAVMRWKFLPGTVDGTEVHFRVHLPVTFRIDGIASLERDAFKLVSNADEQR